MIVFAPNEVMAKGFAEFLGEIFEKTPKPLGLLEGRSTNQEIGSNENFEFDRSEIFYTSRISPAAFFRSRPEKLQEIPCIALVCTLKYFISNHVLQNYKHRNLVFNHFLFVESQIETLKSLILKHNFYNQKVWASNMLNVNLDTLVSEAPRWIDRLMNFVCLTLPAESESEYCKKLISLGRSAAFAGEPKFFDQQSTKIIEHFKKKV